jgi:hypothetical protein
LARERREGEGLTKTDDEIEDPTGARTTGRETDDVDR